MNYTKEIDNIIYWLTEEDGGHAVGEGNIKLAVSDLIELKEALNIDLVSESWYSKLKCLMEGLEIENIELLLATGKEGDYRRLGELMQKRIKELL